MLSCETSFEITVMTSRCQRYLWLGMFEDNIVQEVICRMFYSS